LPIFSLANIGEIVYFSFLFIFIPDSKSKLPEVMKLLFDEITGRNQWYTITDGRWFPETTAISPVGATATICVSRQDLETVAVEGKIEGRYKVICDRCGQPYEDTLQCGFEYLATVAREEKQDLVEQQCSDEEALIVYLAEPVIEINELLREQVLLAVPLKNLCNEDCKGICPGCGSILNSEMCTCAPENNESPFAVLKKLKKQ
jgi:uncharacterized protein